MLTDRQRRILAHCSLPRTMRSLARTLRDDRHSPGVHEHESSAETPPWDVGESLNDIVADIGPEVESLIASGFLVPLGGANTPEGVVEAIETAPGALPMHEEKRDNLLDMLEVEARGPGRNSRWAYREMLRDDLVYLSVTGHEALQASPEPVQ